MKVTVVVTLTLLLAAAVPSLAVRKNLVHGDRTMTKVVKMLQDMLKKSQEDGEKDRDLYAKFKCYCDDNEDEKTLSIEELTKQIGILENQIEELRGSTGELSTECAQLRSDMEENEAARAEAEAIRKKAHEDFVAEEADLTSAIDQMDQAIKTLSDIGADQTMSVGADHTQYMAGHEALLRLKSTVKQALVAASVFFDAEATPLSRFFLAGTLHWYLHFAVW
jgi:TolA-binding protein